MNTYAQQDLLSQLAQEKKIIWILRHGHRAEPQKGAFGNELELTEEGKQASFSLGHLLAATQLGEIHTSPLLRCLQTAEEILKGAHQKAPILLTQVLGDPGPFISDPDKAGYLFLQKSLEEIAQSIVDHRELPGIRSLEKGGHLFLKYVSQIKRFPCLMITHDIIICLLCCFLFKSKNVKSFFPNFLEGFGMTIQEDHISLHHNTTETSILIYRSQLLDLISVSPLEVF